MRVTRLDDYQSWMFEVGGQTVLVDPWLTETFAFSQGSWLFHRGRHTAGTTLVAELPTIDLVVLTSHFADHINPATLAQLDKRTRVLGTKKSIRRAEKLGFSNTARLRPGRRVTLGGGTVEAIAPAFPYSRSSVGLVFRESSGDSSIYLETHVVNAARSPRVDAVITTVESVRLMGIQLAMGSKRAAKTVESTGAKYLLPTGTRPDLSGGLLSRLLRVQGSVDAIQTVIDEQGMNVDVRLLGPGETLVLG